MTPIFWMVCVGVSVDMVDGNILGCRTSVDFQMRFFNVKILVK
jgi:hypothetical protein